MEKVFKVFKRNSLILQNYSNWFESILICISKVLLKVVFRKQKKKEKGKEQKKIGKGPPRPSQPSGPAPSPLSSPARSPPEARSSLPPADWWTPHVSTDTTIVSLPKSRTPLRQLRPAILLFIAGH